MKTFKTYLNEKIKLRGFGGADGALQKKNAEKFLNDFERMTSPHPFNNKARILGRTHVHLSADRDGIHIHDIQSHEQGSGAGTDAMKKIAELADKNDVKVNLFAKGYASTTDSQLRRWYKKFGFHPDSEDPSDLIRKPNIQ